MKAWKRLLAIGLLILPAALPAQWARYGGADNPHSLIEADGGGWVMVSEMNILKLSSAGEVVWGQKLGSGSDYAYSNMAWAAPDGGVIAAAFYNSAWALFKLSAAGTVVWEKSYTLADSALDVFCPLPDGGMLMAGRLGPDLLLCRCGADGEIAWQMSCGTDRIDLPNAAAATSDGGIVVLGSSEPAEGGPPMTDLWVLRLDAAGAIEWQKLIGGAAGDVGETVFQTSDGGYLIAGHTESFGTDGLSRFWLLKLSPDGEILRQQTLDHEYWGFGWFTMRRAADGSFIAAISSSFPGRASGLAIATILEDGTVTREAAYSEGGGSAVLPTEDGGCLLSGSDGDDAHVMKLLPSGEIEWQKTYGSRYSDDSVDLLGRSGDGGYVLAGETDSWGGFACLNALWIMRTAPDGSIGPNCYFISEADGSRLADLSTRTDVAATVEDTAAVPQIAGFIATDANIPFVPWGPTTLPALGGPACTLTVKLTVLREGPFTGEGTNPGTFTPGVGSHSYATGTSVNISVTPNEGYTFLEWSGNIRLQQRSATLVMDGDKTIDLWLDYTGKGVEKLPNAMCFIATAAYGDPSHPDVEVLRKFRDRYLMRSRLGRDFVRLYCRYSPPVAKFVAKYPFLRAVSRAALSPVVAVCSWLLGSGTQYY
jgi:hypothetical protein